MFKVPVEKIRTLLSRPPADADLSNLLSSLGPDRPACLEDLAILIGSYQRDPSVLPEITGCADRIKRQVYGPDVKLFVPLYISNECVNECLYCAYRAPNLEMPRRTLSEDEFVREVQAVITMGYRVIELVTGESPSLIAQGKLARYVSLAGSELGKYQNAETGKQDAELVLMSWALSDAEFISVFQAGVDAFYLWQETYDEEAYGRLHPSGTPKNSFGWRTGVFDRAINAGINRVGLGVLFGLADWKFDVLALVSHGKYLEKQFGVSPDAVGVPRFKSADGAVLKDALCPVTDDELRLTAALYRLAFPKSHIFLNTREKLNLIFQLLEGGGSEMNIACAVFPGGYTEPCSGRQFDYYSYPTDKTLEKLRDRGFRATYFSTPESAKTK